MQCCKHNHRSRKHCRGYFVYVFKVLVIPSAFAYSCLVYVKRGYEGFHADRNRQETHQHLNINALQHPKYSHNHFVLSLVLNAVAPLVSFDFRCVHRSSKGIYPFTADNFCLSELLVLGLKFKEATPRDC